MKDIKGVLDLDHNRLLRLGLLLASTLAIAMMSALVYAGAVFQKALIVGSVSGVTSPGSTSSSAIGIPFATIVVLVLQTFVISLSVFGLPPKLPKRLGKNPHLAYPSPSTPTSKPGKKEEWESSPRGESAKTNQDVVGDILESLRKNSATKE